MQVKYLITGMTCNHCKQSVESNIATLAGVSNVSVDLATKTLTLETTDLDHIDAQVSAMIDDLGYDFEGRVAE